MAFADGVADFRSDTVTRPTAEMLAAMAAAEVGDDVYGEDPTVNVLEEEAAAAVGLEAGLFTPTGSMANQIAINLLTSPGQEVLCVERAHVRNYENGAGAAISGVQFRTVHTDDGVMTSDDVAAALEQSSYHLPQIALLVWENTHNVSGGTVVPIETMTAATAVARHHGLGVHIDGARIFNAVAASGAAAPRYGALADTLQFCFSKGLGAPVGSIVCGSADLIAAGRGIRKRLGGGMRQVGVIAAAARVALRDRGRLAEDHELAGALARVVAERFPGAADPGAVETNMVMVDTTVLPRSAPEVIELLAAEGVRVGSITKTVLRFVTHRDVDRSDVDRVAKVLEHL